jgi:hypothetical protein
MRRGSTRMAPPTVLAMTAPNITNREIPIPCAPNGGIANFERNVALISGTARRVKRSPSPVATVPLRKRPIAALGGTTALPIDHCAE